MVIGVIGNDPTASVAFAIVLNETLTNGLVTGASLLVVQYEALFEDGINLVDSADILDLTDKLFVAASYPDHAELQRLPRRGLGTD